MFDRVRARLGSGPHRRHRRVVSAGGTRSVRLSPRLLLARAGAGPAEPRARLDQEVRRRPEGLAPHRHHLPMKIFALLVTLAVVQMEGPGFSPGQVTVNSPRPNPARGAAASVAGNGTIYVGNYKGTISIIDEATEKLVGEIPLKAGIPGRIAFSNDRSRLYVVGISYETVEIVDREKRQSLEVHTLTEGKTKVRIWGMQPDPFDKYLILVIKKYTLTDDSWEISPPTLVQYDLATKKIARTIPWPKDEEREGARVMFSPDGKLMYLFGEDILIYETEGFKQVDTWNLAQPLEPGAGRVSFGGFDPFTETPGVYTGLFTMNDPLNNRRMLGIGRVDLVNKKVDFRPIGPTKPLSWALSPDRKQIGRASCRERGE